MIGVAAFYLISAGLITAGIASGLISESLHEPLILIWAIAGLVLAGLKILRSE